MAMAEFQANLFASTWVNWLGDDRQRKEMLTGNRESSTAIVMSLLFTLVLVAIAIIGWVCSKLFDVPRLTTNELQ